MYSKIPMLERFAAQSLVEHDGELIFSKEKFAELIVEECRTVVNELYHRTPLELCGPLLTADEEIADHFYGVEE
jgi:hypothetical protein